ncbi:MAG TPA: AAA family ATPase [Desulfomonilia bacterium]|nr:AAA family ATPase [Desulfomonilia bacterium]
MTNDTDIRTLARKSGMPYIDISREAPDPRCLRLLKESFAKDYTSLPVRFLGDGVLVAIADPDQKDLIGTLSTHMGRKVYPALADIEAIKKAIEMYYPDRKDTSESPSKELVRASRTIAIISNKGGVGKTHVALNLAKVLSGFKKKVLLIDADLGNADVSNKLALFPEYTLYDFLLGDVELENMIEKTTLGFDLIAGSSGEFKLANINYVQRSKFIKSFRKISEGYDYAIFDLSAGITTTVLDFALASDEIIIITTPQDIIAGYACIKASFQQFKAIEEKLMEKVEFYKPQRVYAPWVILNQVANLNQGIFIFNKICQTADERINNLETLFSVKPEYLGGVLYDKEVIRTSEVQRKPFTVTSPKSKTSQCLDYLGRVVMQPPETRTYNQELRSGFSRFAMIFGLS